MDPAPPLVLPPDKRLLRPVAARPRRFRRRRVRRWRRILGGVALATAAALALMLVAPAPS